MAIIQEFLSLLKDVKQTGGGYTALCPAHDDNTRSLSISEGSDGRILLKCFAGCKTQNIIKALGWEMEDLFPDNSSFPGNGRGDRQWDEPLRTKAPFTVEKLAKDKGLPASFLESLGVKSIDKGVKITYYTAKGKLNSKQRFRWSLAEKPVWSKKGKTMICYGGWRIQEMAKKHDYIVLVEGESDSWTLWYHDLPAIGVPGADMGKLIAAGHIKPFDRIYIWKEHGKSGETFLKSVPRQLSKLEYQGEVFIIQSPEYDDANDLHKAITADNSDNPKAFLKKWQEILDAAEPVDLQDLPEIPSAATGTERDSFKEKVTNSGFFSGDIKNARRLIKAFDGNMRYSPERKKWLHWNGKVWEVDLGEAALYSYVKATINNIAIQAVNATPEKQEQLLKEAYSLSTLSKQKNMIEQASKEKAVQIFTDELDTDPWLFCCENGTINLKSGELQPHKREDYITKLCPVIYDPDAKSELLDSFLERVLPDKSVRQYVQKAAGYSLTGSTAEEKLFFAFGPPAGGKSTLIEAIRSVLGPHATTLTFDTLLKRKYSRSGEARPDVAKLVGVRFASAVEASKDKEFDEELINMLTGGDTISARHLYGEEFDFKPTVKLWLAANNIPSISGPAGAIWRRLRLIPFDLTIPEKERDSSVKIRLQTTERAATLAWMLEGCLLWQREGLDEPDAVKKLTTDEQGDSDPLKFFLEDCCILRPGATVRNPDIWAEYLAWAKENRIKTLGRKTFAQLLIAYPGIDSYTSNGKVWIGIGLLATRNTEA